MIGPTPFRATRKRSQMLSLLCALLLTPIKALHDHHLRQLTPNGNSRKKIEESGGCESVGALSQDSGAAVFINFSGDPTSLEDNDLRELEAAFVAAFETASSDNCFDLGDVTINTSTESFGDDRRILSNDDTNNHRNLQTFTFSYTLYFQIVYSCNGCTGLFGNNDASRRRDLLWSDGGALPTRDEFNEQFNQILSEDSSFLDLQNKVQGVKATSELEQRQCHPKLQTLDSDLIVVFEGDLQNINDAELLAAEEAIRKAYNTMNMPNPYSCDTKFRKVTHATCIDISPDDDGNFIMSFALEYECRGCGLGGEEEELFNEKIDSTDVGRSDPLDVDFRELGPREPDCSCDKLAQFERAPTVDEFALALRETLAIRRLEGKISFITDVVVVGGEDDNEEEYCCSYNYKDCSNNSWCNQSESRCEGNCNGTWMNVKNCAADGLAKWKACTNDRDSCCSPATCTMQNPYYWQCL